MLVWVVGAWLRVCPGEADVVCDACDGAAYGGAGNQGQRRVLEAVARLPAASATRAVKWVRLVARLEEGVKDQFLALTVASPRKVFPE